MSLLNPAQQKAVDTTEGRVLVLAGAGSGKTRVIIHRIQHLLQKGVPPTAILGLTFTNKAAGEMRERLAKLTDKKVATKVTLSTFHSFCMDLLRKEIKALGYRTTFTLYDPKDMYRLVGELSKEILKTEEIPSVMSTMEEMAKLEQSLEKKSEDPFFQKLYEKLQSTLKAYNALDFDRLLSLTVRLFKEHPAILEKYQDKYRYIMIDEYQDTNPIQSEIAELLAKKYQNLCVVGDDDQSIYGWRGAVIENILQFKADTTIRLEQNYRCLPSILSAANQVIKQNKKRHNKTLFSKTDQDRQIELFHAPTDEEEAAAVIERILYLHQNQGIAFKDIAILYRSNLLARNFEIALMNASYKRNDEWVRGIPYEVFGGLEFSERSEVKDLLAYLKTFSNELDQESLLRIINLPRRGISSNTVEQLTSLQQKEKVPLFILLKNLSTFEKKLEKPLSTKAVQGIKGFVELVEKAKEKFSTQKLSKAFEWLIHEIDYHGQIKSEFKSEKAVQYKWENVLQVKYNLEQYEEETESPSLHHFVSTTMLARTLPSNKFGKEDQKLKLMTFHSAKGLEFEACFIVALEDQILPHEKSLLETGLEEERRLFYVAITRAKKHLILSMAKKRKKRGKLSPATPSRFLFEIPKNLLHLTSYKMFP